MANVKTYVLLDALDNNAPIYQQVSGGKRVQIKKRPVYPLYNQITFQDENSENKTIRYMNRANSIYQDQQIKSGLLANERYAPNDRTDTTFRNGILVTNKKLLIEYMDTYPGNINFKGNCDAIHSPIYRELDVVGDTRNDLAEMRKRSKAVNKIFDMENDGDALDSMLIRMNGGIFFKTPDSNEEKVAFAMNFIDDSEEEGLDLVLKEDKDLTIDETTSVLVGKLLQAGIVTIDVVEGTVSKLGKDNKAIELRKMGNGVPFETLQAMFIEHLNTEDGKTMRSDLEKALKPVAKTEKTK